MLFFCTFSLLISPFHSFTLCRSIANNPLRRQNGSSDEDTLMEELRSSRQLNKAVSKDLVFTNHINC